MCGFFNFICFPRKRELRKNWMCNSTLLSPGVTAAGTGHAFVLRKFRKDKVRGKALMDKQGWEDVRYGVGWRWGEGERKRA